jgi:hypothetical protein
MEEFMKRFKTFTVVLVILLCLYGVAVGCKVDSDSNTNPNTDSNTDEATVKSIRLLYSGGAITGDSLTEGLSATALNRFTANVQVTGGASKDFTLTSSDAAVASVSGKTVTLVAAGRTTLTATAKNDTSKTHTVTLNVVDDTPPAYSMPYHITNNFGEDSSSEFLAQWHNDSGVTEQKLQIVPETGDFANAREITVTGTEFNTAGTVRGEYTARNVFRAHVTGLNLNTRYKYRIGNWGKWSDTFHHLTSGGRNTDFSFTVIADPQSSTLADNDYLRAALQAANDYDEDNRFFLNGGDIVNNTSRPSELNDYTSVANEFNKYRPIAATQGNHDTYSNVGSDVYRFGESMVFNAFVTFPYNGCEPDKNKSQSYYFYYNKVLVIMLNTMVGNSPLNTPSGTSQGLAAHNAQADWLKTILEKNREENKSKYIIVATHVSPFSGRSSERWLTPEVRQAYGKIFTDYEVDIVFAGHDHLYARSNPIKITGSNTALSALNFEPTPNGTIYSIAGSTGPKFYAQDAGFAAEMYFPKITRTIADVDPGVFVNVKVTGERLSVTAKRVDGMIIDVYEVEAKR